MSHKLLLALLVLSLQSFSAVGSEICHEQVDKQRVITCTQEDGTKVVETYFESYPDKISVKEVYREGKLLSSISFSTSGNATAKRTFEYSDQDDSYLESRFYGEELREKRRLLKVGEDLIVLEQYGFHPRTKELESIDILEKGIKTKRKIIENNQHTMTYQFIYDAGRIIGFTITDLEGNQIGEYHQNKIGILPSGKANASVKIAIIDSGFDHQHPDLIDHILVNERDPIDGIDNDQDGLIDNYLGTFYDENGDLNFTKFAAGFDGMSDFSDSIYTPKQFGIPFETISLRRAGKIDSHGTHVASLALRDLEDTSFLPFAGDYGDAKYLELISSKLKAEKVDFVNMSFSFPHYATGDLPRKTLMNLQKLISDNPETVFFVAAGNDGKLFSGGRFNCLYPACYKMDNVVTIGATNDADWRTDNNYEMADFSNYSDNYVDLFAPGTKVNGALLGGLEIRYSGTSMASPMALNIAAKLKELYPSKSALEIKKAMEQSALKVDGIQATFGVIDFNRAKELLN